MFSKNCKPELSCIVLELYNTCLNEACFPDCLKLSSVVSVFENVGKMSAAKKYGLISLLSVISKILEKPEIKGSLIPLKNAVVFSDFQYGFRSYHSTTDLLTVVSDRTVRASFNRSGAARAVILDISRFGTLAFFTNSSLMEFQAFFTNSSLTEF